jgi:adenine/guanine phosphoribosyltransferase-like PRPP-binding protein
LATGGTLKAAEDLVSKIPGTILVGSYCLFEIPFLGGAKKLSAKCVAAV